MRDSKWCICWLLSSCISQEKKYNLSNMNAEILLAPNYRFTVMESEIAARIFLLSRGHKETDPLVPIIADGIRTGAFWHRDEIAKAIREYEGHLSGSFRIIEAHNKIPNVLRYELAKLIAGQVVVPTFKANYLALGNWSTAPANTDTVLDNETIRGLFTQRTALDNVAYLDKFFTSSEVWGMSFLEAGVFVDGAAWVDTGYLLSRVLINVAISATETLTVNTTFTLNSAT